MKKLLLITTLFLAFAPLFSATTVYFYSGKIEIVERGKSPRLLVAVNQELPDGSSLKLAENAEIILKDNQNRFAVIHKVGEFSAQQINAFFIEQQGKSLVTSLAGFLGTQLSDKHADIRKMSESYMKQKGGVTRSGSVFPLMVWPPYGSLYDTTSVRFIWNAVPGVKRYEFVVYGGEDANNPVQLSKTLETDTFMDVDFKDFAKDKEYFFSWVAYPEGDPNYTRYTFKLTSNATLVNLEQQVNQLVINEPKEENKLLIKAIGYEKGGLVSKAEKVYIELLRKYNTTINQQLYQLFQIRNNLMTNATNR